jgi:flagellar L-ring protein precursor FlgH
MKFTRAFITFGIAGLLGACAGQPQMTPTVEFSPIQPLAEKKPTPITGSIFANGSDLFGDLRSYQAADFSVGDLVTVLLSETTQASRTSNLATSRAGANDVITQGRVDAVVNKFESETNRGLGGFFDLFPTTGSTVTSTGSGTAGQGASLTGSISAMVVEILANGNLVIIGEKQLALTEGSEFIQVKGIIRPADIQPDNTILSQRIAHAQISYRGTGDLANASKPAWGNKLLYKFWPF